MSSLLIKNGTVYDGTGNAAVKTDLRIENDQIVEIGNLTKSADRVIDAEGKVVCPGFVDIHRHCDIKPFNDSQFGQAELMQGITTVVVGNCGISMTPASPEHAQELYRFHEPVMGPVGNLNIHSYHDYLHALENTKLPMNIAAQIGTGSVKIAVKGFSDTPYTPEETKKAADLIENAMQEGAPGVSVGIMYLPECYSTTKEFVNILKPVGKHGGLVTAHIRGEGDSMVDSVAEMIEIGKKAGCAVEISHFKSCGVKNWRNDIFKAIQLIDQARSEGQDVTCDFYPYEGGSTSLTTMLPPCFVAGNMEHALKKLGTPEGIDEFRRTSSVMYKDWDNFAVTLGWERILISGVTLEKNKKFLGKTITQAAEEFGFCDAAECAAYLMHSENGNVAIINMSMCQDDIDAVARLPYSNVISDAIYADTKTPHPRMFGAFPKIIRDYVLERKILTLEQAIHKMTYQPAQRMKLLKRGQIKVGNYADLNIFSLDQFRDYATFENPAQFSGGLDYCIVNGQIAVENAAVTGQKRGMVLRANKA